MYLVLLCDGFIWMLVVLYAGWIPDSQLSNDMIQLKEKEGKDHILLNFTYKVNMAAAYVFTLWSSIYIFALITTAHIPSLREGNVFSHAYLLRGVSQGGVQVWTGPCGRGVGAHMVGYGM